MGGQVSSPLFSLSHIMNNCSISQQCWRLVTDSLGIDMNYIDNFHKGEWLLTQGSFGRSRMLSSKALVATCAWAIWKARCEFVFTGKRVEAHQIFQEALRVTQDHLTRTQGSIREYLNRSVLNNMITVFSDASWHDKYYFSSVGFAIIRGQDTIILAGASAVRADCSLHAELLPLEEAMKQCRRNNISMEKVCTDCPAVRDVLDEEDAQNIWRYRREIQTIKSFFNCNPRLELIYCPREYNNIADTMANYGRRNPALSCFHRGTDRPRWLEEAAAVAGLHF